MKPLYSRQPLFQLTPLQEGRLTSRRAMKRLRYFNSRPYTRGDREYLAVRLGRGISTHAPTRGATQKRGKYMATIEFQLTPLHEGRLLGSALHSCFHPFQLTPLHEGRQHLAGNGGSTVNFNSRPYTRGDVTYTNTTEKL